MIRIRPLTRAGLKEAVNLINEIFPEEEEEPPSEELPASLNPKRYKAFLLKTKKSDIKYWVAINDSNRVVGTVGSCCCEKDKNEAFWLGWFCVHPDFRGNGIGSRLLQFAINKAKERSKKFLRLDTSTDSSELTARRLYEKHGFKLVREEQLGNAGLKKLYYELKLKKRCSY